MAIPYGRVPDKRVLSVLADVIDAWLENQREYPEEERNELAVEYGFEDWSVLDPVMDQLMEALRGPQATPAVPLVQYECGCKGFPPDGVGQALLIQTCDRDRDDSDLPYCVSRDMSDQISRGPITPLPSERITEFINNLNRVCRAADNYFALRGPIRRLLED